MRCHLFYYSIFQIYLNFVNYIVNFAFPILTLVVLNYQIYKELRKNLRHDILLGRRHQNEQKKNALRKRDIRLTRISIIIVVIFMVCHIPRFIMNIIEMVYGDLSKVRYTPRTCRGCYRYNTLRLGSQWLFGLKKNSFHY